MKLKLVILFFCIIISKIILSLYIHSPHIVFDETLTSTISHSIWYDHTYFIDRSYSHFPQYPFLYPLLISPLHTYNIILLANCFMSSLIVFPIFYLARQWSNDNISILVALLTGIMPGSFIYTFTMMSENLFLPLFFTSILFMKKVYDNNTYKNNIVASVCISLCVLTKMTAISLVIAYAFEKIWQWKNE